MILPSDTLRPSRVAFTIGFRASPQPLQFSILAWIRSVMRTQVVAIFLFQHRTNQRQLALLDDEFRPMEPL